MERELSQIVRNAVPQFIAEPSLKLLRSKYNDDSCGDGLAEYRANGLRVGIWRDHGELIIEAAVDKQPIKWYVIEGAKDLFSDLVEPIADESARVSRVLNQWFTKESSIRSWLVTHDTC